MLRILVLLAVAFSAIQATPTNLEDLAKWEEFKKVHGKKYSTKEEETARYNIFLENTRYIDEHNQQFKAGLHSFDMGINQFADMTNREFRTLMNGYKSSKSKPSTSIYRPSSNDLPVSVDWRDKGYVTPVKNQDKCGSCWAFSTTGSLEGQHFAKTGNLVSLSEQQLVDCSTKFGNAGCEGGWMDQAFDYIKANNGIDTEESYPYTAYFLQCKFNASTIGATLTGYTDIPSGDESALESAVATVGPISVAIDASRRSFQHYKSGVYYESKCGNTVGDLDHGVLVVGYGVTGDGTKYYIVKNSWADTWGDKGYLLMSREKNNNCGIATKASYPLV